jgi:predicted transglutaminase-like protease
MGNNDGIIQAISSQGTNQVVDFDGGYFSFACGNEIALVLKGKSGYFILNCDSRLFEEVKKNVENGMSKDELKEFWLKKSKEYEISVWSADFNDLGRN